MTAVDTLCDSIERGEAPPADIFDRDAVLDATVPNWRFEVRGGDAVAGQLGRWFRHPATFDEIRRLPVATGEILEYTLAWEEQGVPHACHHAHILDIVDGLITRDVVFCGGRWPADLLAEMGAAAHARR